VASVTTLSSSGAANATLWSTQSHEYGSYSFTIGKTVPIGSIIFGLRTRDENIGITLQNDFGAGWQFWTGIAGRSREAGYSLTNPPQPGDVFTFVWKKAYAALYQNGTLVVEKRGANVPSTALYLNLVNYGGGSVSFDALGPSIKTIASETHCKQRGHVRPHQTVSSAAIADGHWHLATAVYEPVANALHKTLYIDGRLTAQDDAPLPLRKNDLPVCLGANSVSNQEFNGLIDEVAIFARAMSADDIKAMFQAGKPEDD
jgi:hypothetical protein